MILQFLQSTHEWMTKRCEQMRQVLLSSNLSTTDSELDVLVRAMTKQINIYEELLRQTTQRTADSTKSSLLQYELTLSTKLMEEFGIQVDDLLAPLEKTNQSIVQFVQHIQLDDERHHDQILEYQDMEAMLEFKDQIDKVREFRKEIDDNLKKLRQSEQVPIQETEVLHASVQDTQPHNMHIFTARPHISHPAIKTPGTREVESQPAGDDCVH